ncbi:hypothetical protein [Sphaerisporangium sp. NPDC051011]
MRIFEALLSKDFTLTLREMLLKKGEKVRPLTIQIVKLTFIGRAST